MLCRNVTSCDRPNTACDHVTTLLNRRRPCDPVTVRKIYHDCMCDVLVIYRVIW